MSASHSLEELTMRPQTPTRTNKLLHAHTC